VVEEEDLAVVAAVTPAVVEEASTVVEVSAVAVSTAVAFVVAVLVAISVQWEADTRSPAAEPVRGGAAIGAAIGVITMIDSLMMSSLPATSAFRGGGAIRTDITATTITRTDNTVMTITRTITMGTVAGTVTTTTPGMDTAMAADQGICRVCGVADKRGYPKRIPHSTLAGETGNNGGGRPPRRSLPVR
jgi:hypothetical protein